VHVLHKLKLGVAKAVRNYRVPTVPEYGGHMAGSVDIVPDP
jgi:hypothetical protein